MIARELDRYNNMSYLCERVLWNVSFLLLLLSLLLLIVCFVLIIIGYTAIQTRIRNCVLNISYLNATGAIRRLRTKTQLNCTQEFLIPVFK